MLNHNEYKHILNCIKDLDVIPAGSTKWWDKFRWLRERNKSSWRIGDINIKQHNHIDEVLDLIEAEVKKKGASNK